MHLLPPAFLERFDRIVNVHPSLLPTSPARRRSRTRSPRASPRPASTVHLVDEGVDTGPVLRQEPCRWSRRHRETLAQRIHAVEHRLLPEVVRELCVR